MSKLPTSLTRAGLAVGAALLGYATLIEPYSVQIERVTLYCDRLPSRFDGYRVLLLSDFHSRRIGRRETKVLNMIHAMPRHDLVALCGDLIYTPRGMNEMAELVSNIQANDGVCATFGNSEHKNGVVSHLFAAKLESAGAVMLLNRSLRIRRGDESIVVAGVDDPVSAHDDIAAALADAGQNDFQLLLMHTPDSVALACARGVDIVVSGHTHGGQIKLPLIGATFTHSHLGSEMNHGLYKGRRLRNAIGFRPGRTQLYVSRGIGISGLAMRFLCRPEITSLTLRCLPSRPDR
jgi:predicted MPP superfamily phosphohydrolase